MTSWKEFAKTACGFYFKIIKVYEDFEKKHWLKILQKLQ